MEKWRVAGMGLVLCMILLWGYFSVPHSQSIPLDESIGQKIGIKIPEYQDRKWVNDRGWFADGTETAVYQFDGGNAKLVKDQIAQEEQWNTLPPTKNVSYFTERVEWDDGGAEIPDIENGYWYFSDETPPDAHPPNIYTGQFPPPPMNFNFAIFDTDTNTLYYFEYDS